MYKIMYRVNEATAAAREWFEGQCDSYYIKEV